MQLGVVFFEKRRCLTMHAWEQIQQTVEYIEDHIGEEISVEILAGIASLSPFYYQRLFKRLVKKPPAEYVKLRRMARAAEALLDQDRRILDIALELGFFSHEHFTRTFKDTFGVTPDAYRKCPQVFNRMNKPELLLCYTLLDEGVPLVADGIVIEINRRTADQAISFVGLEKKMPVQFMEGLGTESGVDPLDTHWREFHIIKESIPGLGGEEEIGVTYPCSEEGYFCYFAGAKHVNGETNSETVQNGQLPAGFKIWELPSGAYLVCSFEAENFESLVMDALYKAEQYLYNVWIPSHKLRTAAFCAERYRSHSPETCGMEVWLKILE